MKNYIGRYSVENLLKEIENPEIDLEQEVNDDVAELFEKEERKLYVDKVDKSTSDLFRMIIEGELNLQPDYQRGFVWDKKTMSKFIESLLLSIPIPTIFLAENNDDTFEVIDGQQRLTTIFAFMKAKLSDEEVSGLSQELQKHDSLMLIGLETLKQYNRKGYLEMKDMQRKFNNVSLPIVIIKKDSTEDIKYDIFSRINSGAVKLNSQELLNVMYRGELIKALKLASQTEDVDRLFGQRPVLKKRCGYNELLLRAKVMESFVDASDWSLKKIEVKNKEVLKKEYRTYNGRLNSAILEYLKEYRNDQQEAENLKKFIEDASEKVKMVFGEEAFIRINKKGSTSINKTIAELQLVVLSKLDKDFVKEKKAEIKKSFGEFLDETDEDIFIRATNNTTNVEKRYEWGKKLSEI
ncbi:MAG: DUF262 domain-containing protein [Ruminococcaceae bacterium]|nr:DUF262 domain-containing protein [Oscillospiraceae bacterium]